jgi:hypothetical protein
MSLARLAFLSVPGPSAAVIARRRLRWRVALGVLVGVALMATGQVV